MKNRKWYPAIIAGIVLVAAGIALAGITRGKHLWSRVGGKPTDAEDEASYMAAGL